MGPISNVAELKKQLTSKKNLLNSESVTPEVRKIKDGKAQVGNRTGAKGIPPFMREMIAVSAKAHGSTETAKAFGVHRNTANGYAHGKVGGHNGRTDKELISKIEDMKERVADAALQKLMSAVGLITEEELAVAKVGTKASVASSLAGVVDRVTRKDKAEINVNAGVIVYAPSQREERDFPTIQVAAQVVG